MKRFKHLLVMLGTLGLMGGLLWWSSLRVPFDEIWAAFATARWGYAPLAMLLGLMVFPVKAWRWKVILGHPTRPTYMTLFSATMIGFMVNSIFSRIGEIVRAAVLGIKREMTTAHAFASIALERIFDLCAVGLFLVAALLWISPPQTAEGADRLAQLRRTGVVMAALFACGITFLVFLRLKPRTATRLVLFTAAWLPARVRPHIEHFLHSFIDGLNSLRSVGQVFGLLLLSIVHWLFQVLFFYVMAFCFPEMALTFAGAMLIFVVSGVGVAAAPLPLYLGVYQGSITFAALILNVGGPEGVFTSYAWLCWACNIPVIIAIGFGFLSKEGFRLSDLRAKAEEEAEHLEEDLEQEAAAQSSEARASESDSADG
jgi:hypothetical protein